MPGDLRDRTPRDRRATLADDPAAHRVGRTRQSAGTKPFDDFVALIAEQYPLTHATLELERHTEFGLLFHWSGRKTASDGPLVLMAHYDVVPVDESDAWTYPPFEGRIADGSVYGRGALDDKGPLIVILEAVENLLADGFVPARDVYLSFGGNEETYGAAAETIAASFTGQGASCPGSCSTKAARSSTRPCPSCPDAQRWSESARRAWSPSP